MKTRQELACERAERIYENKTHLKYQPAKAESSTTVFKFIEQHISIKKHSQE